MAKKQRANDRKVTNDKLHSCCAVGALALVAQPQVKEKLERGSYVDGYYEAKPLIEQYLGISKTDPVFFGNDRNEGDWSEDGKGGGYDQAETFGWAFRQAMG